MANTLSMMKSKDVGLLGGCKMLLLAALLFCSVAGRADVAEHVAEARRGDALAARGEAGGAPARAPAAPPRRASAAPAPLAPAAPPLK